MKWPAKWRWPWRHDEGSTEEAQAALQELEERDVEVRRLGRQLREAQTKNHFSAMVADAITRTREHDQENRR